MFYLIRGSETKIQEVTDSNHKPEWVIPHFKILSKSTHIVLVHMNGEGLVPSVTEGT